ncbi:unnamed protein product, partial [Phaeothamnion confervicola]
QQLLYEQWLALEHWPLDPVALALLVGVAPAHWSTHVATLDLAPQAEQLRTRMLTSLTLDAQQLTTPLELRAWAHSEGVTLPAAAEALLDFVARALPGRAAQLLEIAPAASSTDKEAVLGAALALVTRFTEDCLDEERMFDGARIARLMLSQAALWFPDRPPRMDEQAIAQLVERYINGF